MLGPAQEQWLASGLARSRGRWNLLGQGTLVSFLDEQPDAGRTFGGDSWNGYPAARGRLLRTLQQQRVRNPVIFTGDMHAFMAGNITAVPGDPTSAPLATEIVATSISSDPRPQAQLDGWLRENPNLLLAEGRYRGHVALRITPRHLRADLMAVDNRDSAASTLRTLRSLVVETDRHILQDA